MRQAVQAKYRVPPGGAMVAQELLYSYPTAESQLLAASARSFVERELVPHEAAVDLADEFGGGHLARLQGKARDLGLFAFNFPQSAGGPGLDAVGQVAVREQLGRTTQAMAEAAHRPPLSLLAANEEQWERFTRPAGQGDISVCLALSEADAGSDLRSIRTRAKRTESGSWAIFGEKHYISHFDEADEAIVLAQTGTDSSGQLTAFIVPLSDERVNGSPTRKMGWRGYHYGSLAFDGVMVDDGRVLGGVGEGLTTVMRSINSSRLSIAAHCVGSAIWSLETAIDWMKDRRAFGSTLAEKQGLRWRVAELWSEIALVRTTLYSCAESVNDDDTGPAARAASALLKYRASELAGKAIDFALQVHGAAGYASEFGLELRYRDVRAYRIGEGASELLLDTLGRHALGPKKP